MALKDFIQKEQSISAPAEVKTALEEQVMEKIGQTNRPMFKLASALAVGLLLTAVVLQLPKNNGAELELIAVESIVQMNGHTAYWVEPLSK